MKARNPSTGTLETVYVKALDSMPVGTQIEYTGDTIPTGWEEVNDYSTTEIDTGKKWIDGKPIYRKTFSGSNGGTTSITVTSSISNIGNVIDIGVIITDNSNNIAMKIGGYLNSSNFGLVYYSKTNGTINITIPDVSAYKNGTYICFMEYTKTTD